MSQPSTPRDSKVTRELVLATALEIIDRDGADALSARRLGAALDRDPMVLYRHAPGKAALPGTGHPPGVAAHDAPGDPADGRDSDVLAG